MNKQTAIIDSKSILPALTEGDGTRPIRPTEVEIQIVEKALKTHLKSNFPKIFARFDSYFRQYTGFVLHSGEKVIRGNFLCEVHGNHWKKEWILTLDGGDCYFNFSFDFNKSELTKFSVNGNS